VNVPEGSAASYLAGVPDNHGDVGPTRRGWARLELAWLARQAKLTDFAAELPANPAGADYTA